MAFPFLLQREWKLNSIGSGGFFPDAALSAPVFFDFPHIFALLRENRPETGSGRTASRTTQSTDFDITLDTLVSSTNGCGFAPVSEQVSWRSASEYFGGRDISEADFWLSAGGNGKIAVTRECDIAAISPSEPITILPIRAFFDHSGSYPHELK